MMNKCLHLNTIRYKTSIIIKHCGDMIGFYINGIFILQFSHSALISSGSK